MGNEKWSLVRFVFLLFFNPSLRPISIFPVQSDKQFELKGITKNIYIFKTVFKQSQKIFLCINLVEVGT